MAVPPQAVIRFYGNLQYALKSIRFKKITFLHRDKLNDPFDPYISFVTDFNEEYQSFLNYVQQHHAKDLQYFKEHLPQENWKQFLEQINNCFKHYHNNIFVFSTSEISKDEHPKDNLYMWGHYGNGHRGVAIEFDTTLLTSAVLEKNKKLGGEEVDVEELWWQINYAGGPPKITCEPIFQFVIDATERANEKAWDGTELAKILNRRLLSKHKGWKTEKEWRLVLCNSETKLKIQKRDLLDGTITAVYLGCLIDDHVKDDLISETKHNFPNAKIFGAKTVRGEFALEFGRLF